jgi:hypothetical protein
MAGTLSKGIKLSYKASSSSSSYTDLTNLQEIPDLGGSADSVEVTTLDDAAHMYINGLKDYGDSLDFTFLYVKAQFDTLNGLSGENDWKVTLPGASTGACTFKGEPSVRLNGVGVNDALTYTLSIKPTTALTWA